MLYTLARYLRTSLWIIGIPIIYWLLLTAIVWFASGVEKTYLEYIFSSPKFFPLFAFLLILRLSKRLVRPNSRHWVWVVRDDGLFRVIRNRKFIDRFENLPGTRIYAKKIRKMLVLNAGTSVFRVWNKSVRYSVLSRAYFHVPTKTYEEQDLPDVFMDAFTPRVLREKIGFYLLDRLCKQSTLRVGDDCLIPIDALYPHPKPILLDEYDGEPGIRVRIEGLMNDPRQA